MERFDCEDVSKSSGSMLSNGHASKFGEQKASKHTGQLVAAYVFGNPPRYVSISSTYLHCEDTFYVNLKKLLTFGVEVTSLDHTGSESKHAQAGRYFPWYSKDIGHVGSNNKHI